MEIFKGREFELFALICTKLKRNGEISWCEITTEVQRSKEGVVDLLNDVWYSAVVEFRCVISSRILYVKFTSAKVKVHCCGARIYQK